MKIVSVIRHFRVIEGLKEDPKYDTMLSYFDSSVRISPIVSKLPYKLQEKWTTRANNFKKAHSLTYPRFWVFTEYIHDQAKIRNDPGFMYNQVPTKPVISSKMTTVKKDVKTDSVQSQESPRCPIHKTTKHLLNDCRGFKSKSLMIGEHF